MSDLAFALLKEGADTLNYDFLLAASGVPEPIVNDDGWFDVVAMSKKPIRKTPVKAVYLLRQIGRPQNECEVQKALGHILMFFARRAL